MTRDVKPLPDLARVDEPDTSPLKPKAELPSSPKPPAPTARPADLTSSASASKTAPRPPALDPSRPIDIDRRSWERLKRGQVTVEGRLDLHRCTQAQAHDALHQFLANAAAAGHRCVLVVTGKGTGGEGVLRQMVPRWLSERGNREKVLTYCPAQPRHGGNGALYVLIKRRRTRTEP